MLYIHAGAHAPAQSGPNSSRLAQTVSFPPEGNQYRSLEKTERIYKFPLLGGKSNQYSLNS